MQPQAASDKQTSAPSAGQTLTVKQKILLGTSTLCCCLSLLCFITVIPLEIGTFDMENSTWLLVLLVLIGSFALLFCCLFCFLGVYLKPDDPVPPTTGKESWAHKARAEAKKYPDVHLERWEAKVATPQTQREPEPPEELAYSEHQVPSSARYPANPVNGGPHMSHAVDYNNPLYTEALEADDRFLELQEPREYDSPDEFYANPYLDPVYDDGDVQHIHIVVDEDILCDPRQTETILGPVMRTVPAMLEHAYPQDGAVAYTLQRERSCEAPLDGVLPDRDCGGLPPSPADPRDLAMPSPPPTGGDGYQGLSPVPLAPMRSSHRRAAATQSPELPARSHAPTTASLRDPNVSFPARRGCDYLGQPVRPRHLPAGNLATAGSSSQQAEEVDEARRFVLQYRLRHRDPP